MFRFLPSVPTSVHSKHVHVAGFTACWMEQYNCNFAPVEVRSIVVSVYVCLSVWQCLFVCLSARISQTTRPNFTIFSLHVTRGRGSVLLWRQCDTLCTSGFVDDVMFSHNGANGQNQRRRVCFAEFAMWRHQDGRQTMLRRNVQSKSRSGGTGDKVCRFWLHLVVFVS